MPSNPPPPLPAPVPAPHPDPTEAKVVALAEKVTLDVFGLKEDDGSPDFNTTRLVATWIRGASEQAVLAAAWDARRRAGRDPVRYFVGMCQNGLREPSSGPGANGSHAASAKPTPQRRLFQVPDDELRAAIEAKRRRGRTP